MANNTNNTNKGLYNKIFNKGNEKNYRKNEQRKKAPTVSPTNSKAKPFMAKKPADKHGDPFEYKMSLASANDILRDCPKKMKPEQYLCDFVNDEYGLMGWCCRVIVEG